MSREVLVASRQVLTTLELAVDPAEIIEYVERRTEHEVRRHAEEQGLQLGAVRITWECHVEATCQPNDAATLVQSSS